MRYVNGAKKHGHGLTTEAQETLLKDLNDLAESASEETMMANLEKLKSSNAYQNTLIRNWLDKNWLKCLKVGRRTL
jgi:hypothetical protein